MMSVLRIVHWLFVLLVGGWIVDQGIREFKAKKYFFFGMDLIMFLMILLHIIKTQWIGF